MDSTTILSETAGLIKVLASLTKMVEANNRMLEDMLSSLSTEESGPSALVPKNSVVFEASSIETIAQGVLSPYTKNTNPGNDYEIAVILRILRQMGLVNADLENLEPLITAIALKNSKKTKEITAFFKSVYDMPIGDGFILDGHRIIDLKNMTQDDSTTGDVLLVDDTGVSHSLSVTCGTVQKSGTIKKCLTNPSAKRFGCTPADTKLFDKICEEAVPKYKAEMTKKYSENEALWKRKVSDAAIEACTMVAAHTVTRYESLPKQEQLNVIKGLLQIKDDGCKKPADYLALVNKETLTVSYFAFDDCSIKSWDPQLKAEGYTIWIYANTEQKIGSTQVKFNCGVWHNGQTSSIHGSWNSTFYLTDLFRMRPCPC